MRLTILHIEGCPSALSASALARECLDEIGRHDIEVAEVVLTSAVQAGRWPFAGSPTFVFDGDDLFDSAARTTELACRVYPTEAGLSGVPTKRQLTEAVQRRLAPR